MKTVKPFRVGALTQTFEIERKHYLNVAVLVCFELGEDPMLGSDIEIWKRQSELGALGVLDECLAKPQGEVLVDGSCFTAGGTPRTGAQVRLAIGPPPADGKEEPFAIDKSLYVIGDRSFRVDGTPSDPEPFTEMPIGWARAFGGPGFAANPDGAGFAPQKEAGVERHRLPNVELPGALIKGKSDRPAPAGFGAYPKFWPQRWSKIGTYDMKWLKSEAPGFARDLDLTHFMTAPEDQRIPGYFRGDERFVLENMHRDKPVLKGRLPGVVGRAFIKQRNEAGEIEFREVPTHLDTVRFFPHADRGLLIFHGLARVADGDADDVTHFIVGCDELETRRPAEHFREVMEKRLDRSLDRSILFREEDLLPKRLLRGSPFGGLGEMSDLIKTEGHFKKNLLARIEEENDKTRANLVAAGVKPADAKVPELPELDFDSDAEGAFARLAAIMADDSEQKARAAREVEAAEAKLRAQFRERGRDFDAERDRARREQAGPPKFSADGEMERLRDIKQLVENAGQDASDIDATLEDPATYARFQEVESKLREAYRRTAHAAPYPAARLDEAARSELRARVETAHREGLGFGGMDLTGADLSEMDLSGAKLGEAFLESADLRGARLVGADLRRAVLARADLTRADLTGAKLGEANLGAALLVEANLSDVTDTEGVVLVRADLRRAIVNRAVFERAILFGAQLGGVDFRGSTLKNALFYENDLSGARFAEATLFQCIFMDVDLSGADFSRATIDRSSFASSKLDGVKILEAQAKNVRFVRQCSAKGADCRGTDFTRSCLRDTDFSGADFSMATLDNCDLGKIRLAGANLYRAVAKRGHFVRADLEGARLVGADLEAAMFMDAKIARADFTGANLFRANFVRAKGDAATSFKEANVTRVFYGSKES